MHTKTTLTVAPEPAKQVRVPEMDSEGELAAGPQRLPPSASHRHLVRWLAALLILGLAGLLVSSWLQYQSTHAITTNAIVRGHLAELGTRLDAVVASVEVDAGDKVAQGDILLRLEDQHLRARTKEAQAKVAALERSIEVEWLEIEHERLRLVERNEEGDATLEAAQEQVAAAEIRAEEAKKYYETRNSLTGTGAVSAENVRAARADWDAQTAILRAGRAEYIALQAAEDRRRLADKALTIRERQVGTLEARLEEARANLQQTEIDLESTLIRAPESGAIVRRIVQPGTSVKSGIPTIVMWLGEKLWVEAWVDEADMALIDEGTRATVTFPSLPGQEFPGRVTALGFASDYEIPVTEIPRPRHARMRSDPVVSVRIELDSPPVELRPGLSAAVAIEKTP